MGLKPSTSETVSLTIFSPSSMINPPSGSPDGVQEVNRHITAKKTKKYFFMTLPPFYYTSAAIAAIVPRLSESRLCE